MSASRPSVVSGPTDLPAWQMAGPATPLPLLAKITMLSLVMPVIFNAGSLSLSPSRMVFLITVPILLAQLFSGKFGRILVTDVLVLFYCFWTTLSIFINNPNVALVFGAMQALTLLGGYLVGRACIRSVADFQALARFYAGIVLVLLPFGLYEAFTEVPILIALMDKIPGMIGLPFVPSTPRMGIDRVQAVFSHPIHFGLFCSGGVSLYYVGMMKSVGPTKRLIVSLGVLFTCFLSVSSGPFLAAVFQGCLIAYLLYTRNFVSPWKILLISTAVIYALLEVMSDRVAIYAIASNLAFNPATASLRMVLWEVGTAQVAKAPWLGIGYNTWDHPSWMTGSIDNYWLSLGVVTGLPSALAMLALYLFTMIRAGCGQLVRGTDAYYARVAITFVLTSLMLTLSTVALWGNALSVVFLLIGSAGFLLEKDRFAAPAGATADPVARSDAPTGRGANVRRPPLSEAPVRAGRRYSRFEAPPVRSPRG